MLNACNGVDLKINIPITNYMEIGRYRTMIANEHITLGNNSHKK